MVNALSADNSVGSTIEALKAELPQLEKQQEALKGNLDAVTQRLEVVSTALSSLQALSGAASLPQAGNGDVAEAKPVSKDTATATEAATEGEPKLAAEAAPATRTPAATRKAAIGRQRSKAAKSTTGGRAAKTATKAAGKKTVAKKPAKKAAAKDTAKSTAKPTAKATTKAVKAPEKSAPASEKATAKAAGTSSERSTGLAESVLGALRKAGRPMRASEVNDALGRDETRTNVNSVRNTLERLRTTERAKRSGRGLYEAAAAS